MGESKRRVVKEVDYEEEDADEYDDYHSKSNPNFLKGKSLVKKGWMEIDFGKLKPVNQSTLLDMLQKYAPKSWSFHPDKIVQSATLAKNGTLFIDPSNSKMERIYYQFELDKLVLPYYR